MFSGVVLSTDCFDFFLKKTELKQKFVVLFKCRDCRANLKVGGGLTSDSKCGLKTLSQ